MATEGLTKYYGNVRGIEGVDLEVGRGQIFGLLGPNGAGKTTTIRLLLDFIRPTRGSAHVLGMDARRKSVEIRRRAGYLPGELAIYDNLTGVEFFEYVSRLRGKVEPPDLSAICERLDFDTRRKLGTLSRGNKQKAGLIQAIMHKPDLLLLDEPTSGLDPLVQEQVHGLLREAASRGATVFLSSHILSEVEELCERVGIVREGRMIAVEAVDDLKRRAVRRMTIEFAEPIDAATFERLPGITEIEVRGRQVRCRVVGSLDSVVKAAARFQVENITTEEPGLEEVFIEYYSGGPARNAR
ncbi:MAG: ABC transporter ATP-binding protein [Chloroflexi bacterium]|nr:ABC transporter ATP-binding protein [Chloroflexota bacterium]